MSKSNPNANKTETSAKSRSSAAWRGFLLIVGTLVLVPQVCAQQSTPVQPCSNTPCAKTPGSRAAKTKATGSTAAKTRARSRVSEIPIDERIPDDPAVENMLVPYSAKVRALEVVIGKLDGDLRKGGVGGGNLGNFVADGIRVRSSAKLGKPVVLTVTNSGGLRKNTIAEGKLRAADIFELLPFENALIEIDLTGEQLLKLLSVVVGGGDALSGARIKYRMNAQNRPELIGAHLLDSSGRETEIDPKATYSIVTIDFLLKLGSGRYSILQDGKNVRPLELTLRNALMEHVKSETAAGRPIRAKSDDRFVLVGPDVAKPEGQPR